MLEVPSTAGTRTLSGGSDAEFFGNHHLAVHTYGGVGTFFLLGEVHGVELGDLHAGAQEWAVVLFHSAPPRVGHFIYPEWQLQPQISRSDKLTVSTHAFAETNVYKEGGRGAKDAFHRMQDIFLEVPILVIALFSLPLVLNDIYMQHKGNSNVSTKKSLFIMQFTSSILWISLGIMNKQWFMLLSATNNIIQVVLIIYYVHRIQERQTQHEQ